jgi:maltooligosyltrehalose trehalohydrolase
MSAFRVWAPHAQRVALALRGERHAMAPGARGWFSLEVPGDVAGADYAYVLDGGEELPDPRSPAQPSGVHARSRVVDHAAHAWQDAGFVARPLVEAVLYELHVGTFTLEGTFDAAIGKLDHLRDLGVSHVELMPVSSFEGAHGWGYDGVDLFAPFAPYGGSEGLKRLVDACHARDLGVILDVVYNHLGPSGNYLARFGPYFTERYRTPWGGAVNYDDAGSDEVRRLVLDNAAMWVRDYHVDGLRLDAVHAIYDFSAIHLLEELAREVREVAHELGREVVVIAESDLNDPRLLRPVAHGGYALDAQWSDDFHHALHAVLTGERHGYYADFGTLADLARAIERVFVYDGRYSPHRDRRHGRPAIGLDGGRFVVSLQNHDQIGNRACGERIGHLVSSGRVKIGAAVLLLSPFVPLLFQGEEWAASAPFQYFTAHEDPALAAAVREGRRREFAAFAWHGEVPDPQATETFTRCKLDWRELGEPAHAEVVQWYRSLLRLRRSVRSLVDPRLSRCRVAFDEAERWLLLRRGDVAVACHLGSGERHLALDDAPSRRLLLASDATVRLEGDAVVLGPDAVAVLGAPT